MAWTTRLGCPQRARVETLLVEEGRRELGVFCPKSGWVGIPVAAVTNPLSEVAGSECPDDSGGWEPTEDVIEKAIERVVLASGAVWTPRDPTELQRLGGIAALLRF